MEQQALEKMIEDWFKDAPSILTRREIQRITGGAISAKTLANLDSKGEDCIPDRIRIRRQRIVYPTASVIDWLKKRTTVVDDASNGGAA